MPDYSTGVNALMSALAGDPRRQVTAQNLVSQADYRDSATELNRARIGEILGKKKRQAELDDPSVLTDVLAALAGVDRQTASSYISGVSGASSGAGGGEGAVPAAEIDPAVRAKLGQFYGTSRLARIHGGKVDDVARAQDILAKGGIRDQAVTAATGGGDPEVMNRLIAVLGGKAYEPYGAGQHGPYSRETGQLADPRLYQADVAATGALGGERAARTAQTQLETKNLETAGLKEPGRTTTRAGGRGSVFEQKRAAWLSAHPNDEQGALEYASGRRQASYSDVSRIAASIAKNEGLTGADYAGRVRGLTEELLAANRGDDAAVTRIRLQNATDAVAAQAPRVLKMVGDRRTRELERMLSDLKAKGFSRDESLAILTNAGLSDSDGR